MAQRTDLHRTICRWLRAFHAALYREFLPDNDGTEDGTSFSFDPPFPIGRIDENDEIRVAPISPHHTYFVEQIKRNRTAGRLDRITCFNGKCVYELRLGQGRWWAAHLYFRLECVRLECFGKHR